MVLATVFIYFSYLSPYDMRVNSFISDNYILGYLFMATFIISYINIPVFAITGLILLFKRQTIRLALFLLTVTTFFIIVGRMVGDAW